MHSLVRRRLLVAAVAIAPTMSCSGGCKRGTPYVPFLADGGAASVGRVEPPQTTASIEPALAKPFAGVHASLAPAGATKWTVDGLPIEAPAGSTIVAALAHDLDGDGDRDVIDFVQPAGGGGGEVRIHAGDGHGALLPPKSIAASDLSLPTPCLAHPTMSLVGPHTVAIDLHPTCGDGAPTTRRFSLIAFAPTPSVRWSARVADAPVGWTFTIDAEATDRDGDGVDDPTLTFGLEGGGPPFEPGERISAKLRFLDRPAGLSRDRTEPEASFQSIAQQATQKAGKKATAIGVAAIVRRLRLLHASICSEGGSPLLDVGGDRGVACGPSRGLEEAGGAEVKAALSLDDVLLAIAARERMSVGAVAHSKKTREAVDRSIYAAAPAVWATTRDVKPVPSTPSKGAPAWGALAFDKGGDLLVRTAGGVQRVDTATFDDDDATDVASWGWEVMFPGKDARLGSVVDACEGPYLDARIAGHDVPTGAMSIALPLLPHLMQGRCASGHTPAFSTTPIAWSGNGLYALVDLDLVLIPADATTIGDARATGTLPAPGTGIEGAYVWGSPRSPSGDQIVVPTRFGLLRRDETGEAMVQTLVRARELEGLYLSLKECAISNDGAHLACIRDGRVVLIDASGTNGDAGVDAASPSSSAATPAPSTGASTR